MENGTLTASDVALLSGENGMNGSAFMWIFALLILCCGGFGGGGFGSPSTNTLDQDIQRGFDNQNMMAQTRDILSAVTGGTAQSVAATNQTFHDSLAAMQGLYNETSRDIYGLSVGQAQMLANQNECCCSTKMEIAQNRYENAMNTASINENTTAQTQKILDAIQQNKIESLQAQVNALELQAATSNVVRYPNAWTFPATNPFCTCSTTTSSTTP